MDQLILVDWYWSRDSFRFLLCSVTPSWSDWSSDSWNQMDWTRNLMRRVRRWGLASLCFELVELVGLVGLVGLIGLVGLVGLIESWGEERLLLGGREDSEEVRSGYIMRGRRFHCFCLPPGHCTHRAHTAHYTHCTVHTTVHTHCTLQCKVYNAHTPHTAHCFCLPPGHCTLNTLQAAH